MRRRPTREALAWVGDQTGARVVTTSRLVGGISSHVHAVKLDDGRTLVLRQYGTSDRSRGAVEREVAALALLDGTGIPAPVLVAADPDARRLLMTRLPGKVFLTPRDPDAWMLQCAQMLPRIHALPVDIDPSSSWIGEQRLKVPTWTARPKMWERIVEFVREAPPLDNPAFIHSDYQHFNMLWSRERLTGIVDWTAPKRFYRDADVAHCRLNLAVLFSPGHAERFRLMYESEAGRHVDPRVDIRGLMSYGPDWKNFIPVQVGGRAPVDRDGMDDRVQDLMELVLRRAGA